MSREAIRRLREDFASSASRTTGASVQLALAEFNASSSLEPVKSAQARHQYTKRERAAAMANLTAYEDVYDEALYDAGGERCCERCAARGPCGGERARRLRVRRSGPCRCGRGAPPPPG